MPLTALPNYLRSHRKRAGLTQDEMAFLLGRTNGKKVSRYECNQRRPRLETVFAYELLFHTPARDLFPGVFYQIQRETMTRTAALAQRLGKRHPTPSTSRKLTVLLDIASRPASRE